MSETLSLGYKFGAWQIWFKKQFDLNIFVFHLKYGGKITNNSPTLLSKHRNKALFRVNDTTSPNDYYYHL